MEQKDFTYKEMNGNNSLYSEKENELVEFFEMYEKEKVAHINLFYKIPPDKNKIKEIQIKAQEIISQRQAEIEVELKETALKYDKY